MEKVKELLVSRRLWVTIIGILILIGKSIFPGFPDVTEYAVAIIIPIASFVVGTSIEPPPTYRGLWQKITSLFKSRKFWATAATITAVVVRAYNPDFPIPDDLLVEIVTVVSAYIIGSGIGDYVKLRG